MAQEQASGTAFTLPQNAVNGLLKDALQRAAYGLQAYIGAEMNGGKPDDSWRKGTPKSGKDAFPATKTTWSKEKQLRVQRGRLFKSLAPNSPDNITTIQVSEGKVALLYGTRVVYASIHESGGFIANKGKMDKWFWAQYKQTKNEFFKVMALSVRKRGGVQIPARPYFNQGVEAFRREGLPLLLQDIAEGLTEMFNNPAKAGA
jgi:phage gpG-like protein